jgi:hypothetical protein
MLHRKQQVIKSTGLLKKGVLQNHKSFITEPFQGVFVWLGYNAAYEAEVMKSMGLWMKGALVILNPIP